MEKEAPATFSPDADFPVINVEKGMYSSTFTSSWKKDEGLPRVVSVKGGFRHNVIPDKAEAIVEGMELEEILIHCREFSKKTGVNFSATELEGKVYIKAVGVSAHASTPQAGNNAVTALVQFLAGLKMHPCEGFSKLKAISRIFPHNDSAGEAAGVKMSDEISGDLTIVFSVFSYSEDSLVGEFDSRVPICANNENMRDVLVADFENAGIKVNNLQMTPGHHVPKDSAFIQTLLKCYEEYTRKQGECIAIGGGTYTHNLKNGVAFGCADPTVDNHMHGADEFAEIDQLILSAKIFAQVIIDMCR